MLNKSEECLEEFDSLNKDIQSVINSQIILLDKKLDNFQLIIMQLQSYNLYLGSNYKYIFEQLQHFLNYCTILTDKEKDLNLLQNLLNLQISVSSFPYNWLFLLILETELYEKLIKLSKYECLDGSTTIYFKQVDQTLLKQFHFLNKPISHKNNSGEIYSNQTIVNELIQFSNKKSKSNSNHNQSDTETEYDYEQVFNAPVMQSNNDWSVDFLEELHLTNTFDQLQMYKNYFNQVKTVQYQDQSNEEDIRNRQIEDLDEQYQSQLSQNESQILKNLLQTCQFNFEEEKKKDDDDDNDDDNSILNQKQQKQLQQQHQYQLSDQQNQQFQQQDLIWPIKQDINYLNYSETSKENALFINGVKMDSNYYMQKLNNYINQQAENIQIENQKKLKLLDQQINSLVQENSKLRQSKLDMLQEFRLQQSKLKLATKQLYSCSQNIANINTSKQ